MESCHIQTEISSFSGKLELSVHIGIRLLEGIPHVKVVSVHPGPFLFLLYLGPMSLLSLAMCHCVITGLWSPVVGLGGR